MPKGFTKPLSDQGCKIPNEIHWELSGDLIPVNGILVGQFAKKGEYDIAIICLTNQETKIHFLWGGLAHCPEAIQNFGETISITNEENIREHHDAYGGENEPFGLDRDALEDIFLGKARLFTTVEILNGQTTRSQATEFIKGLTADHLPSH